MNKLINKISTTVSTKYIYTNIISIVNITTTIEIKPPTSRQLDPDSRQSQTNLSNFFLNLRSKNYDLSYMLTQELNYLYHCLALIQSCRF